MHFNEIPQFPRANYQIHVEWHYLKQQLESWDEPKCDSPLILNPDFQRGHVWSDAQRSSFIEYSLKGGTTGKDIYFNCSSWNKKFNTPVYCIDGLQRLTAVLKFIDNEVPAFGKYFKEYEGKLRIHFCLHMLNISSKKELLKIYLDHNSGGVIHSQAELIKVQKMIDETNPDEVL